MNSDGTSAARRASATRAILSGQAIAGVIGGLLPLACGSAGAGQSCRVVGDARRDDLARAERVCEQVRDRFTDLFQAPPPRGRIILSPEAAFWMEAVGGRWTMRWPTSAALRESSRALIEQGELEGFLEEQWTLVLPHEIGHVALHAYLGETSATAGGGATPHYGTSLPDWFDEAVAVWMEPAASRAQRLARARSTSAGAPRLAEVLARDHPDPGSSDGAIFERAITRLPCKGICPGRISPSETQRITYRLGRDGRVTVDTTYGDDARVRADTLDQFYGSAYATLLYVRERGGGAAVGRLFARLRGNPDDPAPLLGLPGLPGEPKALEADWRAWLSGPPAPSPSD